MRKYQNRFNNCSKRMGMNIWYFIHCAIQTPSTGLNNRADALFKMCKYVLSC